MLFSGVGGSGGGAGGALGSIVGVGAVCGVGDSRGEYCSLLRGFGSGGRLSGGTFRPESSSDSSAGGGGGGTGAEGDWGGCVDDSSDNFLIVSSASFSLLAVAFWKISSSLVTVGKTFCRSASLVLLTMSTRLILIGSRRGESISRLMIDCLLRAGMNSPKY